MPFERFANESTTANVESGLHRELGEIFGGPATEDFQQRPSQVPDARTDQAFQPLLPSLDIVDGNDTRVDSSSSNDSSDSGTGDVGSPPNRTSSSSSEAPTDSGSTTPRQDQLLHPKDDGQKVPGATRESLPQIRKSGGESS